MHVPSSMLHGGICPVSATLSVVGVAAAAYWAIKTEKKPSAGRFAAVSSLIFAAQMLNFPILNGTSGHFLGGTAAAVMLGTPFAVLSLTLVITLQTLLFADGGLNVLGVNLLNMALIGAGVGGLLIDQLKRIKLSEWTALFAASVLAVVLAAAAVCVELASAGVVPLAQSLPAMLGVHLLIGLVEGVIAVGVVKIFGPLKTTESRSAVLLPCGTALIAAGLLSPLACAWPDGLEWVSSRLNILHEGAPTFVGVMPDYTIPVLGTGALSTALAGLAGTLVVMGLAYGVAMILRRMPAGHGQH